MAAIQSELTVIVKAKELKELAESWHASNNNDEPFPLGYFKQSGRFNKNIISF